MKYNEGYSRNLTEISVSRTKLNKIARGPSFL